MSDPGLPRYQSYIAGELVPPSSGDWFETEDPCTERDIAAVTAYFASLRGEE